MNKNTSCPYCGNDRDIGCLYCRPVAQYREEYYIIDPDTLESFPCTEEEYYLAPEEYREKALIPQPNE